MHQGSGGSMPRGGPDERPVYQKPRDFMPHQGGGQQRGGGGNGGSGGDFNASKMVRVYIAAGRLMGMRPADLVGAIANEANVNPRGIGDIEIADAFSLVELPESDADRVVTALRGATLRGRKVVVRLDDGRRKQ